MNHACSTLHPESKSLWFAYLIAPSVAPLVFAIAVFVSGLTWLQPPENSTGTPIGIILVPVLSLTVGMVASYLVAGLIGMPIAFHLRNRNSLNFYTIHGAAFGWSVVLGCMVGVMVFVFGSPRPPISAAILSALAVIGVLSPFILLSATTFWWMVKRNVHHVSLRTAFVATTLIAIVLGMLAAFFRG
ncbi:MAG: hypothetical protein MUF06_18635 [Pirellulaceae bacterium]|jgi:hypothetical protein|nr:hypothetical protein [Pirellulaceae bacterium]